VEITELFALFLAVLTCLPLIKTFCISLSKLRGRLFTILTVYIVSVFLSCLYNGRACDRLSAWSCSLKRAVYNSPDSQCLECYIYRLSTLDTMQKIGVWEYISRDISAIAVWVVTIAIQLSYSHVEQENQLSLTDRVYALCSRFGGNY